MLLQAATMLTALAQLLTLPLHLLCPESAARTLQLPNLICEIHDLALVCKGREAR